MSPPEDAAVVDPTDTDPQATPLVDGRADEELERLRLRVAAQDRLIAAMIEENESIHVIRRHYESRRWYHLLEGTIVYRVALVARNGVRSLLRVLRGLLPGALRR